MPVDTLEQRIDAMHTAQLSLDAPPPATRVSATNVFHGSKRAALTALTALTPAVGRPSGTCDWRNACGNFCNGPWRVNPFEWADPIAGVFLLYGVGARAAA